MDVLRSAYGSGRYSDDERGVCMDENGWISTYERMKARSSFPQLVLWQQRVRVVFTREFCACVSAHNFKRGIVLFLQIGRAHV